MPPAPTLTDDPAVAAAALARGLLVAFPTETVYGLGAAAEDATAVARVFAVKGRPTGHPLIVHGADAGVLDRYGRDIPPQARDLAAALWPGPLTLVVARSARVPDVVTGGRDTVGVRVPAQPLALRMLRLFGAGVAAPSANPFGRTSPTRAEHVARDLGDRVDVILDGGPCAVGVESTILDVTGPEPVVLRVGGVPVARIEAILGRPVGRDTAGPPRAPGMLAAHYAPRARVVVAAAAEVAGLVRAARAEGAMVAVLAPAGVAGVPDTVALHPEGPDADDYARDLYRLLREADARGCGVVVAVPPEGAGIAEAVRDRLARAAAADTGPT